jgi:hypothetical protein
MDIKKSRLDYKLQTGVDISKKVDKLKDTTFFETNDEVNIFFNYLNYLEENYERQHNDK